MSAPAQNAFSPSPVSSTTRTPVLALELGRGCLELLQHDGGKRVELRRPRQGDGRYRMLDIETDVISNTLSGAPQLVGLAGAIARYVLVQPVAGPFATVLVIHENRGLNPYIEDVARRAAVKSFLALAPDGLSPVGGYPGNDDDGRTLQAGLDQAKLRTDMINSARSSRVRRSRPASSASPLLLGGGTTNFLAMTLGPDMHAGVPYYGAAAETAGVTKIKAPLLIQYAENDERINAMWPEYEKALKAAGVPHEMHIYPGTQHGFPNNSTPRYHEASAKLAGVRTIAFFKKHLA